jgi:tetratricopeptide (TPR) repeat protein
MHCGRLSLSIQSCVAVCAALSGSLAGAAPPAAGFSSRAALAIQLNDELKTQAVALTDSWSRNAFLSAAAPFDYLLGRKEEFVRHQEKCEVEAAATEDSEKRIRALRNVALYWAVVEPDRARRLLVQIGRAIEALPADKRDSLRHDLAEIYFELCDYDKAIACAESPKSPAYFSTLLSYRMMARRCLDHGQAELLEKLRNKIRKYEPNPDKLDPQWKIDIDTETDRVNALAAAGLPEEAAALYEYCWSTGISYYNYPGGLADITRAFARAGKRDAAKVFLRKNISHITDRKHFAAVAAAHAGDYPLVDELLAEAEPKELLGELRTVILVAHLRGDVKQRNELFDRYREAASRAPKGESVDADWHLACSTVTLEAVLGRYDAALAMLPKLQGEQACELRHLLIDLILHEQGKTFRRWAVPYSIMFLGESDY